MKKVQYMKKKIKTTGSRMLIAVMVIYSLCGCRESGFGHESEKNDLQLTEVVINVPEMKGKDTYLFMTDNQANFDLTREDLGWFGTADARIFKDENGVSAAENFDKWMEYANESKVDMVLMGGDIIDFYSTNNIDILEDKIKQLDMPFLYTYGNHDSYVPWENSFCDDETKFKQLFAEGNTDIQVIEKENYNIVSIRNYQVNGTAQVSLEALEQFKLVYEEGKPIILLCHVPIYTEKADGLYETATDVYGTAFKQYDAGDFGVVDESLLMGENCGYELTDASREFLDLVLSDDSPVVAILSGHLHKEWSGYITDNIYEYVGPGAYENEGTLVYIE